MTAREYLQSLRVLHERVIREHAQLEDLRARASSTGAMDYGKDRVQTTPSNKLESAVCGYVDRERQIEREDARLCELRDEIIDELSYLDGEDAKMLYEVYVRYKSIGQVGRELGVSYRQSKMLHSEALKKFEKIYKVGLSAPLTNDIIKMEKMD